MKYIPRQWEQIYDPIKIKNNIIKFYEYQIVTLLKECLMVISIPFVLLYLCNYINSIVEFINDNLEHDNKIGYISKKSNFKNIRDDSDLKTIISFKEFRDTYPEWGENIEKFLVNSEIYNNLKNDINIDEENLPIESAISLI